MENFTYAKYTQTNRPSIVTGITLDLNGKTITAEINVSDAGDTAFIKIHNGIDLIINGNGGGITTHGVSSDNYKSSLFLVEKNNKLTINSGIFQSNGIVITENGEVGSNGQSVYEKPTIELNGGSFTSTESTAIYMTADDGELTVADGVSITGNAGIEIRSGKATINGGTITATGDGNYYSIPSGDIPSNPITDGSAIVLVSRSGSYKAAIDLIINGDETEITSSNGATIRNYVRKGDGKSSTFADNATIKVTIFDKPKLTGAVAAIENAHYTGDTSATIVGTFTLNGGYYKAPSYDKLLVGKPTVNYQSGHAMSDTPVEGDYYAPIEVKTPVKPADTNPDGKEVTGAQDSTVAASENVATITQNTGASGDLKVNLTLTYPEGITPQVNGQKITATTAPEKVVAEYADVPLDTSTGGSFQLSVEFSNVTNITNLPRISTVINTEAKEKLENEQSMSLISMIVVDISQMKAAGETPKLTLTFTVPISQFTGKDLNSIEAYHFDGTKLEKWSSKPVRTTQGDNYVFTLTGVTEASPWMIAAKATYPGPVPPAPPVSSSGDGNMENAFRVLFDTSGGNFISPVTYLSYGDKISQPPAPTKDGYTFGGWYEDSACTQGWSFASGINGGMILYAKWTASSASQTTTTPAATAQQTAKATPAATQAQSSASATTAAAPSGTTASGSTSPAMTQAPAPVLGALLGLLAAGVLIRRRD